MTAIEDLLAAAQAVVDCERKPNKDGWWRRETESAQSLVAISPTIIHRLRAAITAAEAALDGEEPCTNTSSES